MHPLLEHTHPKSPQPSRNWFISMQPTFLKKYEWTGQYPWLLSKLDHSVEIPYNEEVGNPNRTHIQGTLPIMQPRRVNLSHRSRWWDLEVLECISSKEREKAPKQLYKSFDNGFEMRVKDIRSQLKTPFGHTIVWLLVNLFVRNI